MVRLQALFKNSDALVLLTVAGQNGQTVSKKHLPFLRIRTRNKGPRVGFGAPTLVIPREVVASDQVTRTLGYPTGIGEHIGS